MKTCKNKIGVTLTVMLVVIAVIVVLASLVITAATRIRSRSQEQLTENTIAALTAALQQFADFGYRYNNSVVDYSDFDFPLDCNGFPPNGFPPADIKTTLEAALFDVAVLISNHDQPEHLKYSGCEVLYFFLSKVPQSRKTLDKIDRSLVTDENDNGDKMIITITDAVGSKMYPLLRVIDPWGTTLHYDYYYEEGFDIAEMRKTKKTFPVITSAGPDKIFGTSDDISSRD